jgi:hypothetical protein
MWMMGTQNVRFDSNLNVPDASLNVRFDTEVDVSLDGTNHELGTLPVAFLNKVGKTFFSKKNGISPSNKRR